MNRTNFVAVVIVLSLGVNILISNIVFSMIPREKHVEREGETGVVVVEPDSPQSRQREIAALQSKVAKSVDEILALKVQLLEAVEAADRAEKAGAAGAASKHAPKSSPCPSLAPALPSNNKQAAAAAAASSVPYLMVVISTVGRKVDYLNPTLAIIQDQMARDPRSPLFQQVRVLVLNNDQGDHPAFARAQKKWGNDPTFVFETRRSADAPPAGAVGNINVPNARVQKQTRDVVALLKLAASTHRSRYVLIMEDDFALCPHGLSTIHYLLDKATRFFPRWITIKISYGMNGILMKNEVNVDGTGSTQPGRGDVAAFADYLLERHTARPPDHLYTEWAAGETAKSKQYKDGRPHIAFRYNLLHHSGTVSSLRETATASFPSCFEPLTYPTLFEIDAFKPKECGHDDMWPCPPKAERKFLQEPYKKPSANF